MQERCYMLSYSKYDTVYSIKRKELVFTATYIIEFLYTKHSISLLASIAGHSVKDTLSNTTTAKMPGYHDEGHNM